MDARWQTYVGVLGAAITACTLGAEPLPEFAYRTIRVSVETGEGSPLGKASFYGFCPDLNLIWPRIGRPDTKEDPVQYALPWQEFHLTQTDSHGAAVVKVPPARWAFIACGRVRGPEGDRIVAVWTDYAVPVEGSELCLRPSTLKSLSFRAGTAARLTHKRFFVRPEHMPIWVPVSAPESPDVVFCLSQGKTFDLWGEGEGGGGSPGFVLSWGRISSDTQNGDRSPVEAPAVFRFRGSSGKASLRWHRHWDYGLTGQFALADPDVVLFSPGEYSIGYTRPLKDGFMGEFVSRYYPLKTGRSCAMDLGSDIVTGLCDSINKTRTTPPKELLFARLHTRDANGHLLRRWWETGAEPVKCKATVSVGGKAYQAQSTAPGDITFQMLGEVTDPVLKSGPRVWQFGMPFELCPRNELVPDRRMIVASRRFWAEIPRGLQNQAQNVLETLDLFEEHMTEISRRTRGGGPRTDLRMVPGSQECSASAAGLINVDSGLLWSDVAPQPHYFGHELGHVFGLNHGGTQELIVETTRCARGAQVSGQESKWVFFDRMNGIPRGEVWYPHTGIYMYGFSRGGMQFLRFMSNLDYLLRGEITKQGIPDEVATAAVLELALKRDMFHICQMYGLCSQKESYGSALRIGREILKKAPATSQISTVRPTITDPPGWIVFAGQWQSHGNWAIGREIQTAGCPKMVARQMPNVPFSVSVSAKNPTDPPGYICLLIEFPNNEHYDFSLGAMQNRDLRAWGSNTQQNLTQRFPCLVGKAYLLRMTADKGKVTFILDGKTIHTMARTGSGQQARVIVCSLGGRSLAVSDFRMTEF